MGLSDTISETEGRAVD